MVRSVNNADMDVGNVNVAKISWVLCYNREMQVVYLGNIINYQADNCIFLKDFISFFRFKITYFSSIYIFRKIFVLYTNFTLFSFCIYNIFEITEENLIETTTYYHLVSCLVSSPWWQPWMSYFARKLWTE